VSLPAGGVGPAVAPPLPSAVAVTKDSGWLARGQNVPVQSSRGPSAHKGVNGANFDAVLHPLDSQKRLWLPSIPHDRVGTTARSPHDMWLSKGAWLNASAPRRCGSRSLERTEAIGDVLQPAQLSNPRRGRYNPKLAPLRRIPEARHSAVLAPKSTLEPVPRTGRQDRKRR
jgi:hypothetical protein